MVAGKLTKNMKDSFEPVFGLFIQGYCRKTHNEEKDLFPLKI